MKFGASDMAGAWKLWRSVKYYHHSPDQLANHTSIVGPLDSASRELASDSYFCVITICEMH
jgi:hypothetical protein